MRALKTIVATAVIVFALTTVAMAGVQHFTKQNGQAAGTQAKQAHPTYTVTLTAAQLKDLMGANGDGTAKADANTHRTQEQHVERVRETTQGTTRNDDAHVQTTSSSGSRQQDGDGTCTPTDHEYDHDYAHDGSGDGEHHSGDTGEGCR